MSFPSATATEPILGLPTLEVIWQPDASACVLTRSPEGELSAGHLHVGMPAVADIEGVGRAVSARRASVGELIRLAESPPAGLELGGTARATFAVLELAQGAVTEGLVHPQLEYDARRWFAFWAATLDVPIEGGARADRGGATRGVRGGVRRRRRGCGARSLSVRGRPHRTCAAACGERAADVAGRAVRARRSISFSRG